MSASSSAVASGSSDPSGSSVQVVVRLRPMNEQEKKHGTLPVVTASTQDKSVTVIKGQGSRQIRHSFAFDNVFTAFSTQEEVFEATLKPVIRDVMKGFESTVFAYGQTGTGKTHTMEGVLNEPENQGVIPRSAQAIFDRLKQPQYKDHTVTCSYLEIYNEELCDLLADSEDSTRGRADKRGGPKLEIMGDKNGTFCRGLSEKEVSSSEDVLALMHKAQQQRKIGETKMNKHSSRSHCIFTMRVHATLALHDGSGTMEFNGKLHMVDLAGSECAKTASLDKPSGADAARERERMNINRSLLTLGRVISMLKEMSEGKKVRIPYRDSKLTRILQESLGGRCKTVIVATLSPSVTAIEESISTLNYAQSANGIINKPVSSSYLSVTPGGTFSKSSSSLAAADISGDSTHGNAVEHWHEMECRLEYMQAQVEEAQAALARKHLQHQELVDRAEKAEADQILTESKLYEAKTQIASLERDLKEESDSRRAVEVKLGHTELALQKTAAILTATKETEQRLTREAGALLQTLDASVAQSDNLHSIITQNLASEASRKLETRNFYSASNAVLDDALASLAELSAKYREHCAVIASAAEDVNNYGVKVTSDMSSLLRSITEDVETTSNSLKAFVEGEDGMLSTSSKTSSATLECVKSFASRISDGEGELLQSCTTARERLTECSMKLKEFENVHQKSSTETLAAFDKAISESRSKISSVVQSMNEALSASETVRAKCHADQVELLSNWKTSSVQSSNAIAVSADDQNAILASGIGDFRNGMRHNDDMDSILETQRNFLRSDGKAHLSQLSRQSSMIAEQDEVLSRAQDKQNSFRETCLRNIMSGVKELVDTQMAELTNMTEEQFACLKQKNESIRRANTEAGAQATSIIGNIDGANSLLAKNADAVRSNERNIVKVIEEAKESLSSIAQSSRAQLRSTSEFAAKADKGLQDVHELDLASEAKLREAMTMGEECSSYLKDTVNKETTTHIGRLSRSCSQILAFSSNSIVAPSLSSLSDIVHPRKDLLNIVTESTDMIEARLHQGGSELERVSERHAAMSEMLVKAIASKEKSFNNDMGRKHLADVDCAKNQLLHAVDTITVNGNHSVAATAQNVKKATKQIEEHAIQTIRMNEEVDAVPGREPLTYNRVFSKTPLDEEIVGNLGMSTDVPDTSESKGSGNQKDAGVHDGEGYAEKENLESFRDRRGSDEGDSISVRSGGSSTSLTSPVSPALQERSVNEERALTKKSFSKFRDNAKRQRHAAVAHAKRPIRRSQSTPVGVKSGRKKMRLTSTPTHAKPSKSTGFQR